MARLALRAPLGEGESPASFCSRLALRNGRSPSAFCVDMGIKFRDVVYGEPATLAKLADLGDVPLADLAAFAFRKTDTGISIAGVALERRDFRRRHLWACAACLHDDVGRWGRYGAAAPYGRSIWMLDHFRACPVHDIALRVVHSFDSAVALPGAGDFAGRLKPVLDRLPEWLADSSPQKPTPLEAYLNRRIRKLPMVEASWLDDMPLRVVIRASIAVGATETKGKKVSIADLVDAAYLGGAVGFEILRGGPSALGTWLDRVGGRADVRTGHAGGYELYGWFYTWLQNHSGIPEYAAICSVAAERILGMLAIAPEREVLGQPAGKRRLHSVRSVALETGIHPKLVRKLLDAAGFLNGQRYPNSTDDRTVMKADDKLQAFIDRAKTIITVEEACKAVGLKRGRFLTMVEAGFIKPFLPEHESIKSLCFAEEDIDAFLDRLHGAETGKKTKGDWGVTDIVSAARRANRSAVEVVRLVLDGKLKKVLRDDIQEGFPAMFVDPMEVRSHLYTEEKAGLSIRDTTETTHWSEKVIFALERLGHLEMRVEPNPVNRYPQKLISAASIERFDDRYIHIFALANQWRMHHMDVLAWLDEHGIRAAFDPKLVGASFFERSDLEGLPPPPRRQIL